MKEELGRTWLVYTVSLRAIKDDAIREFIASNGGVLVSVRTPKRKRKAQEVTTPPAQEPPGGLANWMKQKEPSDSEWFAAGGATKDRK
ncbi:MAG TPA: hypothetical protein VH187_05445 [Scandinavium sp.]|jgi:hypothetical protein|uniref:hypothetical protein n=1 Tax=Scandinavium sp. TaxID=2830653 RepID=UPI002E33187F|nr:hypothetical protein [Scandinavium sp.]HEX4500605.1 hypothetical protein [Scandinavium sp.]